MNRFVAIVVAALFITTASAANSSAQTPVEAGYRDFDFGSTVNSTPTGEKPESKVWFNDGSWWGSLFSPAGGKYHIHQFDPDTQAWTDTGTALDPRPSSKADVLWDQATQKLYVASHIFTTIGAPTASNWGRVYRYSYDAQTRSYSLDPGFPVDVTRGRSETLTLAKDGLGRLFVTYIESSRLKINWSRSNDLDWGLPVDFPGPTADISVDSDDISGLVSFPNGNIGLMWSNQNSMKMLFSLHLVGDIPALWQPVETVPRGSCQADCADDHISMKTDSSNRLYAMIKTGSDSRDEVLNMLAVRGSSGWSVYNVGLYQDHETRSILQIDEAQQTLYVFATTPESGGNIYYKTSPMSGITFPSGIGAPLIVSSLDTKINNASSTKQNVDASTGLLVIASDQVSHRYFHNYLPLGGSVPTAPGAPSSLDANATSSNQVHLTWTDGSNNETTFEIERASGAGGFALLISVGANVTSYDDTSAAPATDYTYRVRARNAAGASAYTNSASATTPPAPSAPPSAPTDLTASSPSSAQVHLEWTDASADETSFHIFRGNAAGDPGVQIATTAANVTTFDDTNVAAGTTYNYRVRASNSQGDSTFSNEALVTTGAAGSGTVLKAITFESGSLTHSVTGADRLSGTGVFLETGAPIKDAVSARIASTSSFLEESFAAENELYVSFYLRLNAIPASDVRLLQITNAGTTVGNLILRSTGTLRLRNASTTIGSDSASMTIGSVYRVAVHQRTGPSGTSVLRAFLTNGDEPTNTPFASLTTGTWLSQADRIRIGSTNSGTIDLVVDDIMLNDASMPPPSEGGGEPPAAPPTPANFTATGVDSSEIHLEWSSGLTNASSIHIERADASTAFTEIAVLTPDALNYADRGLEASTAYDYRIRARNAGGFSAYSPVVTATTLPPGTSEAIKAMSFEDGSLTHAESGADRVNGAVVLESAAPVRGAYSARISAGNTFLEERFAPGDDIYVSMYVRVDALPGSDQRVVLVSNNGSTVGNIQLRSNGRLRLRGGSSTIGVESAPLVIGQVYRIGIRQRAGSGGNAILEAYLAAGDAPFAAPFAATTTGAWTTLADRARIGATTSNTGNLVVDEIRIDGGSMPAPTP